MQTNSGSGAGHDGGSGQRHSCVVGVLGDIRFQEGIGERIVENMREYIITRY